MMSQIAENLAAVRARIAAAAARTGRDTGDVELLAVSKTFPASAVAEAYAAGQRCFGENRVQELEGKAPLLPADIQWHLIGHLQANKVRAAVKLAAWIHSVDSLALLQRIDRIAGEEGKCPAVLLEVNVSGEESKSGMTAEEARQAVLCAGDLRHLTLNGFMTMAPLGAPPEVLHRVFGGLRELRDSLRQESALPLPVLSMGMSGDFEAAVADGATIVRVGSAIFGARTAAPAGENRLVQ